MLYLSYYHGLSYLSLLAESGVTTLAWRNYGHRGSYSSRDERYTVWFINNITNGVWGGYKIKGINKTLSGFTGHMQITDLFRST